MSPRRPALLATLLLCAAMTVGLASCGKKGSPEAPGPGDRITYPRSYPTE